MLWLFLLVLPLIAQAQTAPLWTMDTLVSHTPGRSDRPVAGLFDGNADDESGSYIVRPGPVAVLEFDQGQSVALTGVIVAGDTQGRYTCITYDVEAKEAQADAYISVVQGQDCANNEKRTRTFPTASGRFWRVTFHGPEAGVQVYLLEAIKAPKPVSPEVGAASVENATPAHVRVNIHTGNSRLLLPEQGCEGFSFTRKGTEWPIVSCQRVEDTAFDFVMASPARCGDVITGEYRPGNVRNGAGEPLESVDFFSVENEIRQGREVIVHLAWDNVEETSEGEPVVLTGNRLYYCEEPITEDAVDQPTCSGTLEAIQIPITASHTDDAPYSATVRLACNSDRLYFRISAQAEDFPDSALSNQVSAEWDLDIVSPILRLLIK